MSLEPVRPATKLPSRYVILELRELGRGHIIGYQDLERIDFLVEADGKGLTRHLGKSRGRPIDQLVGDRQGDTFELLAEGRGFFLHGTNGGLIAPGMPCGATPDI